MVEPLDLYLNPGHESWLVQTDSSILISPGQNQMRYHQGHSLNFSVLDGNPGETEKWNPEQLASYHDLGDISVFDLNSGQTDSCDQRDFTSLTLHPGC